MTLAQGYIKTEGATVRLRSYRNSQTAKITVKGHQTGLSRSEYEYDIPYADACEMQETLCLAGRIEKTRHLIECGGMLWEIDEFHGDNDGLIVAEIELNDENQDFERPDWLGEDVSFDSRYRNSALCTHPFKDW